MEWLMTEGQTCPLCGGSLAPIQQSIHRAYKEWDDFVHGVEFIVDVEERWDLTISDEQAIALPSLALWTDFVFNALSAHRFSKDFRGIQDELCGFAANRFDLPAVDLDFDPVAMLRQAHSRRINNEGDRAPDIDEDAVTLEAQYERGYRSIPEDPSEAEALLPHLPIESGPWD